MTKEKVAGATVEIAVQLLVAAIGLSALLNMVTEAFERIHFDRSDIFGDHVYRNIGLGIGRRSSQVFTDKYSSAAWQRKKQCIGVCEIKSLLFSPQATAFVGFKICVHLRKSAS